MILPLKKELSGILKMIINRKLVDFSIKNTYNKFDMNKEILKIEKLIPPQIREWQEVCLKSMCEGLFSNYAIDKNLVSGFAVKPKYFNNGYAMQLRQKQ